MTRVLLLAAATVATVASGAAQAEAGRWTGRIVGGLGFGVGGNVHSGASAPVANLGTLNPGLAGVSGTLEIGSRSQHSVYGETWGVGVEIGRYLTDRGELFASVRYDNTGRGFYPVGRAVVPALNASLPIFGSFGNQENWSAELGYRQYLKTGSVRPYVGGRAGVAFSNRVNASFTVPDAGIALNDVPFYRPSALFTGGLDAGVAFDLGRNISLIGETGVRYVSGPRGDDTALSTLGLSSITNAGDRWDIPVRIGLGFAF